MTTVPVNETTELKWKLADGTLRPINELTEEELANSRKICAKRVENYYRNYEFKSSLKLLCCSLEKGYRVATRLLQQLVKTNTEDFSSSTQSGDGIGRRR